MDEPRPASETTTEPEAPGPSVNAIHFVRTLQQITLGYSQMADQKASILMGATFIVFTIAVRQARQGGLPISLSVLALFAFASAVCAIFAVLPSTGGSPGRRPAEPNMLFFGHFARQDEAEWIESMMPLLRADSDMYRVMLLDIHQNCRVLQRKKYRFLGLAYRIFVVGLNLTVVTFVLEMLGLFGRSR